MSKLLILSYQHYYLIWKGVKTAKLKNQKYLRYAKTTNGITIYDFNNNTFNNNTLDGSRENNGPEYQSRQPIVLSSLWLCM